MIFIERGKIDNGSIVFSKPLPFPEGTEVVIHIEAVDTDSSESTTLAVESTGDAIDDIQGTPSDFASLPFFGMWADREDMRDSVAWVRNQREKWLERLKRTE